MWYSIQAGEVTRHQAGSPELKSCNPQDRRKLTLTVVMVRPVQWQSDTSVLTHVQRHTANK